MSKTAAREESFMQPVQPNTAALPWLSGRAVLDGKKAPDWLRALRETGAENFSQTGLPTPAWEGWRYTNLRSLNATAFHYSAETVKFDIAKLPVPLLENIGRVVVVNGQYQPQLSNVPKGVMVMSLMDAAENKMPELEEHLVTVGDLQTSPLKALNAAYAHDGIVLKARGEVETPVEILFYNTGDAAIYPRVLYWLEKNSGLTLLERHTGEGSYLVNSYTAVVQEETSRLKLYKFEEESLQANHFSYVCLQQHKDSTFEGFSCATGGRLTRQEYQNLLLDSGISCNISGIYLLKGQQSHDFTILADHFEPNGTSVQHFKGVINDQARAVFQGKIHVRRPAQKTDGYQLAHALLLSDEAEADFKPELEIYADDVKCSHGATTGRLDDKALFYLRSRGIPEAEARALLIESFLSEGLEKVTFAPVRNLYQERITAWLSQ